MYDSTLLFLYNFRQGKDQSYLYFMSINKILYYSFEAACNNVNVIIIDICRYA